MVSIAFAVLAYQCRSMTLDRSGTPLDNSSDAMKSDQHGSR